MHDENSFITLTYSPEHLPPNGTLSLRDVQTFIKRLRKYLEPKKIRFFLCGEYGEDFGRPHYHAIIFGHAFPDRLPVSRLSSASNDPNIKRFTSARLTELWGLGKTELGNVAFDSAAYVANYATKKITGPKAAEHYKGRKPEFLIMSRRKGIGHTWFEKFGSDVYPADEVIIRGKETRPPRYYDQIGLYKCLASTAAILARREALAEQLEVHQLHGGVEIAVSPSRNARRLAVREKVASAKSALKRRTLEK